MKFVDGKSEIDILLEELNKKPRTESQAEEITKYQKIYKKAGFI